MEGLCLFFYALPDSLPGKTKAPSWPQIKTPENIRESARVKGKAIFHSSRVWLLDQN